MVINSELRTQDVWPSLTQTKLPFLCGRKTSDQPRPNTEVI